MLSQTDAVKKAWAATDRTLDIIVTIDGKDYQATEINSLNYDAGAFTGDTLGIGSTYENSVTIEFSSVVEAFKQGLTVLPKVGILVNGKFEYTKLGTFIISEVNRDRNNNLTTIKALDQMCKLEGQYKPTVSDTASPLDIIADIANQGGVSVNTGELQHLPTLPNIKRIEGQTLRTAIGWIAQLYDGFAAFDRDGKLTIRTTATPDYTITPGEYQQGGLTKNEVAYKTGGIKVTVNTKKTDDSGQEVDDTTTLQAGETTGSQIELTNDSMTSDLLATVWTGIKDITYYPYTLNWFGNPNLEAGDWVTLTDTQGNQFNVPVNQYTMAFNGGLESTISATQSSSTAGGYAYTGSAGSIKNMIEALQVRHTASGNNVYPPSYQGQPQNPKKGDVWYKQNGNNIEVWIYQEEDGKLSWVRTPLDGEVKAELQAMGKKTDEDLTRVKSELSSEAESQWQSAKTATSETDQRLTSLQAEQNASLADLHDTADSLHAAANSLHADADSMRASLTGATSELGKDITATRDSLTAARNSLAAVDSSMRTATSETASELASTRSSLAAVDADMRGELTNARNDLANTRNSLKTATSEVANDLTSARNSLAAVDNSLRTATSEVGNNLTNVKNSLAAVDADLRNGITKAGNDLADAKTSLAATGNSLATATSELQRKTGQLSGSLSTADSMIMYNSNAIAEVKRTAGEISTTVSNIRVGGRNLLTNTRTLTDVWNGATETVDGFTAAKMTKTAGEWQDIVAWNGLTNIKPNTDYVLTFYAKASQQTQINSYFYNIGTGDTYIDGLTPNTLTTDYQHYTVHFHTMAMPTGRTVNCLPVRVYDNVTVWVYGCQLEEGNTATQWQPNPADTDQAISKVSQTADTIRADLTNTQGDVASVKATASSLQSQITDNKNNIASVTQTAQGLTTRVSNAEGNVSGLQQTAAGLQTSVANAQGDISTLKQTANGLSSTISNMKSGGANMLPAGKLQSYYDSTVTYDAGSDTYTIVNPASANAQWGSGVALPNAVIEVPWGQTACISMQVYSPTAGTIAVDINNGGDGVTTGNDNDNRDKSTSHNMEVPANTWTTVWFTYENSSTSRNPNKASLWDQQTGIGLILNGVTWKVRHPMVQIGTFPSEWSPSPKDTDSAISQLKITADGLTTKVADTESNVSSLQLTAKGLQTQVTNNKNDVASLQVKADGIRTDLTNANNDIASVRAKADSLTTSMANANDQISTLQHRADSITSTLSNGGRNLLSNTREMNDPSIWGNLWAWDKGDFYHDGGNDCRIMQTSTQQWNGLKQYVFVEAGKKYTFSIDAKSGDNSNHTATFFISLNSAQEGPYNRADAIDDGQTLNYTPTWTRYSFTITALSNGYVAPRIERGTTTNELLQLARPQFEYGETATPWQPSNGDISSLQQTAEGLTADMKDAKGNISNLQVSAGQLTTDMQNANKNISSIQQTADRLSGVVGDANSGLVSSVNAIPGKISSAITASKQATVIASAVDLHNMTTAGYYLLKGTLTNSPVDAWAFLRVVTSDSEDRIYHRIWKDNASTVYTEEWTGSWSDWATHINSDNLKSNVITAINQSTEGVSITGAKITLDGNVNVAPGFTLSADRITAGTLSADRISGGTLNFGNITVNGLTANSISSGSISGQNLNINLDNGTVEFTKGNLHSTDGGFNISIDNKSFYLDTGSGSKLWIDNNGFHLQESATQHLWMNKDGLHNYTDANGNGLWINDTELRVLNSSNAGLVAKDGILQFSANPIWNSHNVSIGTLDSQLYGAIGFNSNLWSSSLNGIFIKGREGVMIGTSSYNGGSFLYPNGIFTDVNTGSGINLPERANDPASIFTKSTLTLFAGPGYSDGTFSVMPNINIGCNVGFQVTDSGLQYDATNNPGNSIYAEAENIAFNAKDWVKLYSSGCIALDAKGIQSFPTYRQTTSAGANVYVAPNGWLCRSSSARKYKTDIQDANNDYGNKLIEFTPQKWIDKAEKKRYEEDPANNKKPGYYYGLIADDLDAAGLDMLVNYGAEGEVEGINYDRLAVALLPVIKSLKDQVASLKEQIKALTK